MRYKSARNLGWKRSRSFSSSLTPPYIRSATLKALYTPTSGFFTTSGGSTATTNGGAVKDWRDATTNANNAVTAGNGFVLKTSYVNGLPIVNTGDSISNQLRAAFTLAQPATYYMMVRLKHTYSTSIFLDGNTVNTARVEAIGSASAGHTLRAYSGSFDCTTTIDIGLYDLLVLKLNGASSSLQWAGNAAVTGNPGSGTPGGITIGNAAGSTFNQIYDIGHVAVYSGIPNSADDTLLRTYFRTTTWNVANANYGKNVVCFGDSLTAGYPLDPGKSWPYKMQTNNPTWNVVNAGMTGRLAQVMGTAYTNQIAPLYRSANTSNVLILYAGANDFITGGDTAANVFTFLQDIMTDAANDGWTCRICTHFSNGYDATVQTKRNDLNTLIYGGYSAGQIVDFAANGNIGDDADCNDATYFNADKVHLTEAGNTVCEAIAAAAVP